MKSGDPSVGIPLDKSEEFLRQCLEDDGWTVSVKWDGSLLMNYPSEQADAFQRTMADCQEQAEEAFPPKELDRDQIERAYEAELSNRDCLLNEGYEIEQPPSLQVFIDTVETDRWTAFASVAQNLSEDAYRDIILKCTPPTME